MIRMETSPQEMDSNVELPIAPEHAYHCVCGHEFTIVPGRDGQCPACYRRVLGLAFQGAYQATVSLANIHAVQGSLDVDVEPIDALTHAQYGHFRIDRPLGRGGMGAVYRALDTSLQRYVAVKVMRRRGESFSGQVDDMLREAVAQARLNHPNVVTIYYVGRHDEEPFLAMELLPGPTLAERVKVEGNLPYSEAIEYAKQIASALKHASLFDLIHADIKPANIIMAGKGRVKLSDFGLARTRKAGDDSPVATLAGTPQYVAPELIRGEGFSIQSDMYALGITLFELVFGHPAIALMGESIEQKLASHLSEPVQFPNPWPNAIPREFRTLIEKLLAKNPAERFSSYDELIDQLQVIAPVSTTPAGFAPRLMAYVVDQICLLAAIAPFAISIFAIQGTGRTGLKLLTPIIAFASLIVPALYLLMIYKGWRSPGRYLFQLQIVEEHGLPPRREQLVPREVLRNAFAWLFPLALYVSLQSVSISKGIEYSLVGLLGLNSITLFLLSRRKALHDYLCHSHVVLATDKQLA